VVEESEESGTDGCIKVWQTLEPMAIQTHSRGSECKSQRIREEASKRSNAVVRACIMSEKTCI